MSNVKCVHAQYILDRKYLFCFYSPKVDKYDAHNPDAVAVVKKGSDKRCVMGVHQEDCTADRIVAYCLTPDYKDKLSELLAEFPLSVIEKDLPYNNSKENALVITDEADILRFRFMFNYSW